MIGCIGMIAPVTCCQTRRPDYVMPTCRRRWTVLDCATLIDPAGASGAGYTRCRTTEPDGAGQERDRTHSARRDTGTF